MSGLSEAVLKRLQSDYFLIHFFISLIETEFSLKLYFIVLKVQFDCFHFLFNNSVFVTTEWSNADRPIYVSRPTSSMELLVWGSVLEVSVMQQSGCNLP